MSHRHEWPKPFYIVLLFDEELLPEFQRKTDQQLLNELKNVLEDIARDLRSRRAQKGPRVYWLLISEESTNRANRPKERTMSRPKRNKKQRRSDPAHVVLQRMLALDVDAKRHPERLKRSQNGHIASRTVLPKARPL